MPSRFSHDQEHATPGYYRVFLETPKVTAELTATARCGFHKYTFPASDQAHIILDLVHGIGNRATETSVTWKITTPSAATASRMAGAAGARFIS